MLVAARHRCVVTFHGIIQSPSTPGFITFVFGLAPGGDLAGAIGLLTPEQQYAIAWDIVEGLAHLHSLKILHLDLKPGNILLNAAWMQAQLTGFGAARLDAKGETIMTRQVVTTGYAAPEVLAGEASYPADTWSLGAIICEMVTGKPMDPLLYRQFASRKPVDLSGVKNLALRQLLSECFGLPDERPTIPQIARRLTPEMFGASTVPQQIAVLPQALPIPSAQGVRSPQVQQPPAKIATGMSLAQRAAVPISGQVAIPAAPVGTTDDFRPHWDLANRGDAAEQFWIGQQFLYGNSGVQRDLDAAVSWFRSSAEGGNTDGMNWLGLCHLRGDGLKQDLSAAASWFQKSAEGGNTTAMRALSDCYKNGKGVKQDLSVATSWLRKSAEGGNLEGMRAFGICYLNGDGVKKDWSVAVSWFQKSAEGGSFNAMVRLGLCYLYGCGVGRDDAAAVTWFRKSVEGGNAEAMNWLGDCCRNGSGVQKDLSIAVSWFRKSAEGGNTEAMSNLSFCYLGGLGVKKDVAMANFWCKKASGEM